MVVNEERAPSFSKIWGQLLYKMSASRMFLQSTIGKKTNYDDSDPNIVVIDYGHGANKSKAPDPSTRGVSEALFSSKPAGTYSRAHDKEEIEEELRNKEIGVSRKKHSSRSSSKGGGAGDATAANTLSSSSSSSSTAASLSTSATGTSSTSDSRHHGSKSSSSTTQSTIAAATQAAGGVRKAGSLSKEDAYRLLRDDPTYKKLSKEFATTHNVDVALDLAKYLVGKDDDEAEKYFKEALSTDPTHARTLSVYAIFAETVRKDYDHAEKLYQAAALTGIPSHLKAYAQFLRNVREDDDLAAKIEAAIPGGGGAASSNSASSTAAPAAAAATDDDAQADSSRHHRRRHHHKR